MTKENFYDNGGEGTDNLRMGGSYPPIKVYLSMIEIAKLNSLDPVVKPVILSDGKEMDLEIVLETDRNVFTKQLREVVDGQDKNSS